MGTLLFDEVTHTYTCDGHEVPSVTQVLRFANADIASSANPYLRKVSADRGSRIHQACTAYDIDGVAGITEECDDILPYISAYKSFLDDYQIKGWDLYERPLYYDVLHYAGTIDRYGKIDGLPTVLDIKTGSKLHMKIHSLQLCAYSVLLQQNGYKVERGLILHLRKDGTYRVVPVLLPNDGSDGFEIFLGCLNLHYYLKGA